MPKFKDIPQFSIARYTVNHSWRYIGGWIKENESHIKNGFFLNPDFQRGHVWTEQQKIDYIEYCLRGGQASQQILFNCPGWMHDFRGPMVCVDGLQRITAALDFMDDKVKAFGSYCSEYDKIPFDLDFVVKIFDLDEVGVLELYIDINAGGTQHTTEEIEKVRKMLKNIP